MPACLVEFQEIIIIIIIVMIYLSMGFLITPSYHRSTRKSASEIKKGIDKQISKFPGNINVAELQKIAQLGCGRYPSKNVIY